MSRCSMGVRFFAIASGYSIYTRKIKAGETTAFIMTSGGIVRFSFAIVMLGILLPLAPAIAAPGDNATSAAVSCDAVGDLHFVCGLHSPEDLVSIPDSHWIIASGMVPGGAGGLFLVDTSKKAAHKISFGNQILVQLDRKTYPGCTAPPDNSQFESHGLSLRMQSAGHGRLYVVAHGREAIEVFDVDARSDTPILTYRGCALMPNSEQANAVTSLADGSLFTTVFFHKNQTIMQMFAGARTGDVYSWKPGDRQFKLIPGTSLAGDNGIEISPDGATLYVNATGDQKLYAFSLANPKAPPRSAHFDTFTPDNLHWTSDGRLIVGGQYIKDPRCPGPGTKGAPVDCNRAPAIALVDPATLKVQMLYSGKYNPKFGGNATGLIIGHTLWLSSLQGDRIAYLDLPPLPKSAGQ
jgi:SMP-30/Gluconolactonase/LRE-like region